MFVKLKIKNTNTTKNTSTEKVLESRLNLHPYTVNVKLCIYKLGFGVTLYLKDCRTAEFHSESIFTKFCVMREKYLLNQ